MRTKTIFGVVALALGAVLAAGCKDDKKESSKTEESKPAPVASGASGASDASAAAAAANADASAAGGTSTKGNMANCPSSVAGAKTDIKDGKDSVIITVTATDATAASDIRARAKVLTEQASRPAQEVKHTGGGEGSGAFGRCPVVMRNTQVSATEVEGGTQITVKPADLKELDWLKRESRDRLGEIAKPGVESAGQGKMAHCPSAVQNAKTTVKDTKDGVEVTVVAQDAKNQAAEKEIRDRGKALVDASKVDPTGVHHTGAGAGGGGFGRCPVVLKDTVITAKDIPGGASFSVKANSAPAIAELRKEAKERAANFGR